MTRALSPGKKESRLHPQAGRASGHECCSSLRHLWMPCAESEFSVLHLFSKQIHAQHYCGLSLS